jgi:hypothetical protein
VAKHDEIAELASSFQSARRPFIALVNTCPQWTPETASTFHDARNKWVVETAAELRQLGDAEAIARRRLLLALLRRELRLDEEQRDVSASDGLGVLRQLLADVL